MLYTTIHVWRKSQLVVVINIPGVLAPDHYAPGGCNLIVHWHGNSLTNANALKQCLTIYKACLSACLHIFYAACATFHIVRFVSIYSDTWLTSKKRTQKI